MYLIEWDDTTLSVGIETIDREHKVLVQCINELAESIRKKAPINFLEMLFDRLISYTQYHFASEEAYFKNLNAKDVLLHQLQHKHFIEQLYQYKDCIYHDITVDLLESLLDWLVTHIQCEDMKFIQENKINDKSEFLLVKG